MSQLHQYKDYISTLQDKQLTKELLLVPELLLAVDHKLSVYYIPFEYVNESAKVMIIGITPGFTQMKLAYEQAIIGLGKGNPYPDIDKRAKGVASFAGSMRKNLYSMLDAIGLPEAIGIESSEALFEKDRHLLHTTSAVRYPVFRKGNNYTGHQPELVKSDFLMSYARSILLEELRAVKEALIVPLGKSTADVLEKFIDEGELDPVRCLLQMPHPSGANGHRFRQFAERKDEMERRVKQWFLNR
ncbi:uracil-DNA glycosylase family protein [Paenibacillus sp. NEAU-GSW1]|uniref:uracil-DNA glycosylase family protein n=1 Tax=Paenibacillus sp. NEAU-GSW1 TaxID=2682486 RepID=UPI0015674407|nr:uracil-DNA glycosylase family protein [Paenibacillus sp. NEAU-GSW1]